MIEHIQTGNRVEISLSSDLKDGPPLFKFITTVDHAKSNNMVAVLPPISPTAGDLRLPTRSGYEMSFFTKSGILVFEAKCVGNEVVDGERFTHFVLTSKGKKVQQRDFFRLPIGMDFTFTVAGEELEGQVFKGKTRDLSGNGMSFTADLKIPDNTEAYISFIFDGEYVLIVAKVFGGKPNDAGLYNFAYRARFTALTDREQEKIIRFINKKQLTSFR